MVAVPFHTLSSVNNQACFFPFGRPFLFTPYPSLRHQASMQHHTKKITTILVFAIQEWILIILLLINSLFSYLIAKFIAYFGLKPPCLWCSGVGSFLDHHKDPNSYTSIFCEFHATEILKILGYCFDHRELAESQKMRNEFSFNGRSIELSPKITFCSWARKNKNENEKRKFERSSVTIEPHGPPGT